MSDQTLMMVGPTEIEQDILQLGSKKMMYHRSQEFSRLMEEITGGLKYVFQTQNHVFTLTSSGTGAMEAAVVNTLNAGDNVIAVNGGVFGERWGKICRPYGINVTEITLKLGHALKTEQIGQLLSDDTKAVFLTVNETSTGTLTDIAPIGEIVKGTSALLIVDAISSICVEPLLTDAWGIDVAVASSQKGLALPPGLSFLSFSGKAFERMETAHLPKFYFQLKEYQRFVPMNHFPFTPATSLLFQLNARLKKIRHEGIENMIQRYAELTQRLRNGLDELGLEPFGQNPGNSIILYLLPREIHSDKVIDLLEQRYGIILARNAPGLLKDRLLRIGILGDLGEDDITRFIDALKEVMSRIK